MRNVASLRNPVRSLPFAFDDLPDDVSAEFVPLRCSDGADVFGVMYRKGDRRSDTVMLAVHPRGDYSRFYMVPGMTEQGYDFFCLTTRYLHNDTDAQHERMLLDLAVAMRELRGRGYDHIVLVGNSGGGSLTSFYQAQAVTPAEERTTRTPAGDRIDLPAEDMPLASAQVHVAVHIGEGAFMRECIDPSVVDESDPLATDPALDMYDPRNGRRPHPEASTYDREWLREYRAAQLRRTERIDAIALGLIEGRREVRRSIPAEARAQSPVLERQAAFARYMIVYRTLANPFYTDPTIDPSTRLPGSSFTGALDPIVGNYGLHGLGRIMTPRAWLSTWSPTHSRANMLANLPLYDIPTLFVHSTGDTEIPPAEFDEIVGACKASDVTVDYVGGDHYLAPHTPEEEPPRAVLDGIVGTWMSTRFPT